MGIQKDGKVLGVGGDIQWTDPLLVSGGSGTYVYAYAASRLNYGYAFVKWGWKKNTSNTYKLLLAYIDGAGFYRTESFGATIPVHASLFNYDFHFFGGSKYFFRNHQYVADVSVGPSTNQIAYGSGDTAFAGVDVSFYKKEHLRNPPISNPEVLYFDCSIYFGDMEWYKEVNQSPGQFVWKPWNNMAVDAITLALPGSGQDNYRSTADDSNSFFAWNVSGEDIYDPCGDATD